RALRTGGDRAGAGSGAGGVRTARAAPRGPHAPVRGDGRRDRGRLRGARRLRHRAPPPPRVPLVRRPRVGAARGARRAGAPLPQPGAPGRGARAAPVAGRDGAGAAGAPVLAERAETGRVIDLKTLVREVPDFPEPGVGFKDISPLLLDPRALRQAVHELAGWTVERKADLVLGAEARGFWLGAAIACAAGC